MSVGLGVAEEQGSEGNFQGYRSTLIYARRKQLGTNLFGQLKLQRSVSLLQNAIDGSYNAMHNE